MHLCKLGSWKRQAHKSAFSLQAAAAGQSSQEHSASGESGRVSGASGEWRQNEILGPGRLTGAVTIPAPPDNAIYAVSVSFIFIT